MKKMMIGALVAVLSLAAREATAGDDKAVFDGTNYVALKLSFTNRVESFTNKAGEAFVGVRVATISPEGLTWWATNGFKGGRVALDDLTVETRAALKIPEVFVGLKAELDGKNREAKLTEYFDAADRRRAELAASDKRTDRERLLAEFERLGVFSGWTRNGGVVRLKVGASFFLLDFDQKATAIGAVISQAKETGGEVQVVRLFDRLSNKEVGTFSDVGLRLN